MYFVLIYMHVALMRVCAYVIRVFMNAVAYSISYRTANPPI